MTGRRPPRYVPTLTEVVPPPASPASDPGGGGEAAAMAQEEVVRRVLQRVDAMLERRLRERVAAVVMEQTQALAPLLQAEIEASVRQAVAEAFEQEFGRRPGGN
ncbi:hypothetical protein RAMLITH_01615 [Ramlibacter sp. RBP-2]|uniref:DUF2486 family protein n=1 Tax=Ramlibacter lithotrophicus TaxID=2606681 RepID=A0A7X6DC67_9BURK|nr:hypothetical protein [Ramlibacter lithotrophicus]